MLLFCNTSFSLMINLDNEENVVLDAHVDHFCAHFVKRAHGEGYDHICFELKPVLSQKKTRKYFVNRTSWDLYT